MTGPERAPHPALARAGIDRAAHERDDADLVARLRTDPNARVVLVQGDRTLVSADRTRLQTVPAEAAAATGDVREWAFLGRDDGAPVLLAALAPGEGRLPAPGDARWASLRGVGGELDAVDAGLFVEAAALARWLLDAPFCPACGARTQLRAGGWARHCPSCGREHFPRTDPAVIVAIASADGSRLLLGKNALWADRNVYSTFAGFVEAGESLEAAIVREVLEEAGVRVVESRYRASQAWPYPRSLMLGFHASVAADAVARADGVEIVDARWFSRAELADALAGRGEVGLPGSASIARRLIDDWVESAA